MEAQRLDSFLCISPVHGDGGGGNGSLDSVRPAYGVFVLQEVGNGLAKSVSKNVEGFEGGADLPALHRADVAGREVISSQIVL